MLKFISKIYKYIKEGHPNSYRYQRNWAKRYIKSGDLLYSDHWGKVNYYNPGLGDYRKISTDIRILANPYPKEVIDLGCLDGKWSVELAKCFSKVHCVDLTDELHLSLAAKLNDKMGKFYKTQGNELHGFQSKSIDLIFSIDSLVRCPKSDIIDYLKEFFRVLRSGGGCYLHLPCSEKPRSVSKGFTSISISEIESWLQIVGFVKIEIDIETLEHGVIVKCCKN
jgi:ubiquinone/menaquinone biosynthesis C-methylase UbiE